MTLYDSSVLIDYLDGTETAVEYVEANLDERALAPQLALFEVYQGEVFKSGPADFGAVDGALGWLTPVTDSEDVARSAAELQRTLDQQGDALAARDAFIAGAAIAHDERLAVADSDFDVEGVTDYVDVDILCE